MALDTKSTTIYATIVAPMVKEAGQASAQETDAVVVQTASNGTEYTLFKFRQGLGDDSLPKGVIDCRPTRVKAVFADQVPMPLADLEVGNVLAFASDTWDYAPDDEEADFEEEADSSEEAPF
tara:strand:- start:455 stop:820 length:366 start_codon:yes stop_codon:yes gene_type:complete